MMQINRKSLLFRIAYMGTVEEDEPEQVDRCTLVWRFIPRAILWPFLSLGLWFVFGLVFGIFAHIIYWPFLFFFQGNYPAYEGPRLGYRQWDWLPGYETLHKLNIFDYEREEIAWLNWMGEGPDRWSPVLALFAIFAVTFFLWVIVYAIPFVLIPTYWPVIGTPAVGYAKQTVGWFIWPILLVSIFFIGRLAYKKFVSTDSGKVLVSHFKEWKSAHCPIYKVV